MKGRIPQRQLGFWILTALVMGNMIGSGIFLLPSALAEIGTITIFSWVVTAFGAIFLSLIFSRLSMIYPQTGGPYVYCLKNFGEVIGFQVAICFWVYMAVGAAGICIAFTGYLASIVPLIETSRLFGTIVAFILLWIIIGINIRGVYAAGAFQLVMTILKIIPLILVSLIGLFAISPDLITNWNVTPSGNIQALSQGTMLTLWAFLGLESACIPADEVQNPKKTIPRATVIGVLLASLVYILSTVVIMGNLPLNQLSQSSAPFALLAFNLLGPFGRILIILGALVSCIGTLNGWVFLQAQIIRAAARDQLFPDYFSKISKTRSPYRALLFSGIFISLMLLVNLDQSIVHQFANMISLATLAAIIAYLFTTVADVLVSIRKEAEEEFVFWKRIIIPIFAFIYVFWAITGVQASIGKLGLYFLLASIALYAISQRIKVKHELQKSL